MCQPCAADHTGQSSCQCSACGIPFGTRVRGTRMFGVDCTTYTCKHPNAVFPVGATRSPWCALHFLMCVSERLFQPIQDLIVTQLSDAEVVDFNRAMRELCTGFCICKAAADKVAKWLSVSFNGTDAIRAMRSAELIINQAFPEGCSADDRALAVRLRDMFEAWQSVAEICLARQPTMDQRSGLNAAVFRWVS
eukprot:3936635-Rhodomonas_salina.1